MCTTLLSTRQVAEFVARGFLELPAVADPDLCAAAQAEMAAILAKWGRPDRPSATVSGTPLDDVLPEPSALGAVLRLPAVRGAIDSLVGPEAVFDHDFVHMKPAGDRDRQALHCDAALDSTTGFDIQLFFFPHDIGPGEGGTGFVPGTHLRDVHTTDVARYQHLAGERSWEGPAGTVLIFHQSLWHRGMPNPSAQDRWMYKIRLNPTVPQVRRWDTSDLDAVSPGHSDHVFATTTPDTVPAWLRRGEPWMGPSDHRLELMARARLWRHLSGDDAFDIDWYLTRHEQRSHLDGRASADVR